MAIAAMPVRRGRTSFVPDPDSPFWPTAGIVLLLAAQCTMIVTRAVNWDEFHYYAMVEHFRTGQLPTALQTFHVRLFGWLPAAEDNVDAIVAARWVMFACELVTLACIYAVARRFADQRIALLSVLAYLSTGYVLQHGFAFRTDPQATAALMVALAVLARAPLGDRRGAPLALMAGAPVGLSGMITIKAVLFAPAFLGLAWMRLVDDRHNSPRIGLALAAMAASAVTTFALLYQFHAADLSGDAVAARVPAIRGAESTTALVLSSLDRMFFIGVPNQLSMMVKGIFLAPITTVLVVATPIALIRGFPPAARERIALAGLWFPALTLAFYENAASYYYAFMLAPVVVSTVAVLELANRRIPVVIMTAAMVSLTMGVFVMDNRSVIDNQRRIVNVASQLVPEGSGYFDHADMLPRLVKSNGFMTPWGMQAYRDTGRPLYREAMEAAPVPLLLANWWVFGDLDSDRPELFSPRDAEALRENYIHVSGPLFLAGRQVPDGSAVHASEFLVPGPYTAHGAPLILDGDLVTPGQTVHISRGVHHLRSAGKGDTRLVWGTAKQLPEPDDLNGPSWVAL